MQAAGQPSSGATFSTASQSPVGAVPLIDAGVMSMPTTFGDGTTTSLVSSTLVASAGQPITVAAKQGDFNSVTMATSVRSASPAPSEASTSSSNQSLDLMRCKKCSVESCSEILVVSGKRRKGPWMCNYHRNKMYKAKKKQRDENATRIEIIKTKHEDTLPKPPNLQAILSSEQPPANDGLPRLDQVLNEKKLALLRSPAIIQFLRESQRQLSDQSQQESKPAPPTQGRTSAMSRGDRFRHASPP